MGFEKDQGYLVNLVRDLSRLPKETEWLEFKVNNVKPDDLGANVSALANSAALCEKDYAYIVWGIDDATRNIVGTDVSLANFKVGNEEIENWLLRSLNPSIDIRFFELNVDNVKVLLLKIPKASSYPLQFQG